QLVGVDRLARADQPIPRARLVAVRGVAPGEMVAAGVAVRAQHGVAAIRCKPAIGLVDDRRLRQDRAVDEAEISQRKELVVDRADILGAQRRSVIHRDLPRPMVADCATPPVTLSLRGARRRSNLAHPGAVYATRLLRYAHNDTERFGGMRCAA